MSEEAKWYVVHTYSGYENKVKEDLEKTVENRNLQDMILEVKYPTEEVVEIKDAKRKVVQRKVYPGYVMIKMIMNDKTWYVVRNTRGVTGFVGPGSKPIPLTDEEVTAMGVEHIPIELDIAVGESVRIPLRYYENNLLSTIRLLKAMETVGVKKMIFSSSATVYGDPASVPIREDFPTGGTTNPYGTTKYFIEQILQDLCVSDSEWGVSILRYFNPIGAHKSGRIGEDPNRIPGNLMPYITQVAIGKLECLNVCGNDYPTPDGTGVRDYIHVVDLALGHIKALDRLLKVKGCEVYNLGTGKGYSVLDVVKAFEKASGIKINYRIAPRRAGDVACCYADATKAKEVLGWQAQYDIDDMCADSWRWQSQNPNGLE